MNDQQYESRPELTAVHALTRIFTSVPVEQPRPPCPYCADPLQARDLVTDAGGFVGYRTAYLCWSCGYWRADFEVTWTSDY